ncbi:effector-associated constant component EACC1 [Streptomyces nigrescens]|uniref:effector-associated constant component EACC1 n=1 Tax=Streptomyces nigrescens TaxID=1920 RepID=UPI0036FEDB2E
MPQIEVHVDEDDQDDALRSLRNWLTDDSAVRTTAEISLLEHPKQDGAMGGVLEAVQLVTENGWSAASFVLALATWRQTRGRTPRITLRQGDIEVTLSDASAAEIERVIAALTSADADQPDSRRA